MEPSEFYTIVRRRADLESAEEAETAADAVLETLSERLSHGEAGDLARALPDELADVIDTDGEAEEFDPDTFLDRVQERAGIDEGSAKRITQATTNALGKAISGGEFHDARQQLPQEYGELFGEPDDAAR